jgi:DNA mismatch repair ATPase MutS
MPTDPLSATYAGRVEKFEEAIRKQSNLINLLSIARLLALVGSIWLLVAGIQHSSLVFYILSPLMFALFLSLVSLHNKHNGRRELRKQQKALNETELLCLKHDYHALPDGAEHAKLSHPWSHDLDIFGTGSLYQFLNRTSTRNGDEILATLLTSEAGSVETIQNRQNIIADLKERIDFRQHFTARGRLFTEKADDHEDINRWLKSSSYINKYPWLFFLALGMSLISISIITWVITDHSRFWNLIYVFMVNLLILSPFLHRTMKYQSVISRKHDLLKGYAQLLKIITHTSFKHPELQENGRRARVGMREVTRLSKLMQLFDQRLNMLLGFLLNGFFLFDFVMLYLLERWKRRNLQEILDWIELCGWTDAMVSLSGFAWNHPDFVLPRVSKEQQEIEFSQLGHPLIPGEKRVNNDISIDSEKVVVITGANMAGKSTLLRSLGVNMVLAYTGCPVCAQKFDFGYMGLYSSMRTADSLKDEESYFLAEIKKLHLIVERMEKGLPLMILLDEVLKGTNTTDKKRGSVGLIKRTLNYPVRCFIATHDLSLGELEASFQGEVVNYCFESYIEDMVLSFDYTMRRGIATNMNAYFLMKQMGIVD